MRKVRNLIRKTDLLRARLTKSQSYLHICWNCKNFNFISINLFYFVFFFRFSFLNKSENIFLHNVIKFPKSIIAKRILPKTHLFFHILVCSSVSAVLLFSLSLFPLFYCFDFIFSNNKISSWNVSFFRGFSFEEK